ncbi:MAG: hypothetical protein CL565_05145 [Alphaproteobacteria bacterium]|nr:hypothetical protein [Alphaproteobacteria bacterium]
MFGRLKLKKSFGEAATDIRKYLNDVIDAANKRAGMNFISMRENNESSHVSQMEIYTLEGNGQKARIFLTQRFKDEKKGVMMLSSDIMSGKKIRSGNASDHNIVRNTTESFLSSLNL